MRLQLSLYTPKQAQGQEGKDAHTQRGSGTDTGDREGKKTCAICVRHRQIWDLQSSLEDSLFRDF